MSKKCKKCGGHIPSKIIIDGKERNLCSRLFCLECSPFGEHNTKDIRKSTRSSAEWVTLYRQRLKWKLVQYKGGKCQICGYDKPIPAVYDFHHRDPSKKKFSISCNLCKSFAALTTEADKCDLLCCRCHREFHSVPCIFNVENTPEYTNCSVCGKKSCKPLDLTCSKACAARKLKMVQWCTDEELFNRTIDEIAKSLGISGSAVSKRRKEVSLKKPHLLELICERNRSPKPETRKVQRPTKEVLEELIKTTPLTTLGEMYGVSGNAVKKWAINYEITSFRRWGRHFK